jgi:hypothetical protein
MHDPGGFGSGNSLPQPFGIVSWRIFEMEVDTSKRLPTLGIAEIPFDVRQNRRTKNFASQRIPAGKARKLWNQVVLV